MLAKDAKIFVEKWLPAWTGNNPELLASFYTDDAIYSDPAIPNGVKGKSALLNYFKKLLAKNPNWVWTSIDQIPMDNGFVNIWKASIPVDDEIIECKGVCLVFIRDGKIYQNNVHFDRSELLKAMEHRDTPRPNNRAKL